MRNTLERAVLLGSGPELLEEDLVVGRPRHEDEEGGRIVTLRDGGVNFDELEKDLVRQALERSGGNQTRAGELLGMTRDQVHYPIEKYGLKNAPAQLAR